MVEARVEYDYDAENEDELSLQVGDVITNIERKEDGWWEGHLRGKVGLFPSNFVKILNKDQAKQSLRSTKAYSNGVQLRSGNPVIKRKRRCRVVYSYTPVNDDELELEVNNVIEVLEEVEEGWWKGILHGQVGVFPSNFVVEIDDVDEATSDSKQISTSSLTDNGEHEIKPKPVRGVDLGIILDEKSIQLKPVQESLDRKSITAPKKPPAPTPPVSNDAAPVLPPKPGYQEDLNYRPSETNLLRIKRSVSVSDLEDLQIGNNKEQEINETTSRNEINSVFSEKVKAMFGFPATSDLINIYGNFFEKLFQMYYGNCNCLDSLLYDQRQYDSRLEREKITVDSSCKLQESSSNPAFNDSLHKICLAASVYEDLSNSLSPSRNMISSRRNYRNLSSSSIQNERHQVSDQNSQGNNFNLPQLPVRKKEKGKTMHSKKSPSDKNFHVYHFTRLSSEKPAATLFDKFMTKFVGFYDKLKPIPNDICNQCKPVKDLNISKEPSKLVRKSSSGMKTNRCLKQLPKSRTTYYHGTIKARGKKLELTSDFLTTKTNIASELVQQLFENLIEIVLVFDILRTNEGIADFQAFFNKRDTYELPDTSFVTTTSSSCIEQNANDLKYKEFEEIKRKLSSQKSNREIAVSIQKSQQKKNTSKIPVLKHKKNRVNMSSTNEREKSYTLKKTKASSKVPELSKTAVKTQKDPKTDCCLQTRHLPINPNPLLVRNRHCGSTQNSLRNTHTKTLVMSSLRNENCCCCCFKDVDNNDARHGITHRSPLVKKCHHSMPSLTQQLLPLGSGIPSLDNVELLTKDGYLVLPSLKKSQSCSDVYPVIKSHQSNLELETVLLSVSPQESPQSDSKWLSDECIGYKKLISSNSSDIVNNKNSSPGSFKNELPSEGENMHFNNKREVSDSIGNLYPLKRKNSLPDFQIKKDLEGCISSEFKKSSGSSEISTEDFSVKDNSLNILELSNCKIKPDYLKRISKQCFNETKEVNSPNKVNRCSEVVILETDCIQNKLHLPEDSESLNNEQFISFDKNSCRNKHSVKFDDSNNQIFFSEKLVSLKPVDSPSYCNDLPPSVLSSGKIGWFNKERNNDSSCYFQNKSVNQTLSNKKNDCLFDSFEQYSSSPSLQPNSLRKGSKSPKTFSKNRISFTALKKPSLLNDGNKILNFENCVKVHDYNYDHQDNLHQTCDLASGLHKKSSISCSQPEIAVYCDNDQTPSHICENLLSQVPKVNITSGNLSKCEKNSVHSHQDPLESSYVLPCLSFSAETNERFRAGLDTNFTSSPCGKNSRSKSLDREAKTFCKWKTNSLPSPYKPESYLAHLAKRNLLSPTIQKLNAKYGLFENLQQNNSEIPTNKFIRKGTRTEVITSLKEKRNENLKNKSKVLHSSPLKRSFSNDFIKYSVKILHFKKYSERKLTPKDILSHSI